MESLKPLDDVSMVAEAYPQWMHRDQLGGGGDVSEKHKHHQLTHTVSFGYVPAPSGVATVE